MMINNSKGKELINELLKNPLSFNEQKKAYELLQEYFDGLPIETLIPLIESENYLIREPATWIVSELGNSACKLLPHMIKNLTKGGRFVKYYSLEFILGCAVESNTKEFIHIVEGISDEDELIRVHSMNLIANADKSQVEVGINLVEANLLVSYKLHQSGLKALLNFNRKKEVEIINMIEDENDPITRKYGAILAKKNFQLFPGILHSALKSYDNDIKLFAKEAIELLM